MKIEALAKYKSMDISKLRGFCWYLHNEDIVQITDDQVSLTQKGRDFEVIEPWYIMLIGGYAETFLGVGQSMKEGEPPCTRNAALVGIGSCGISHYDAIPLTRRLMKKMASPTRKLLDLGCGNAMYLTEFCQQFPDIQACGVEPSHDGYRAAISHVQKHEMSNRIRLFNQTAQEFMATNVDFTPDLLVLGFVLHEIFGQDGEEGVKNFLRLVVEKYPEIYLIVIEVEDAIQNEEAMKHGLAKTYYNPYYLLHYFTNQKLVCGKDWERIFGEVNLQCLAQDTTDKEVDSTKFELGYLLKKR